MVMTAGDDRAVDARSAWTAIAHLFISEGHRREAIAEDLGMALGDLITLFRLPEEEAPSQRELADQWACDASWVTTTVDRLELRGLVERRAHGSDRRVKTVLLTSAGAELRERGLDLFYGPPSRFDRLSDAEIARLARLLDKLDVPDPGAFSVGRGMPVWSGRGGGRGAPWGRGGGGRQGLEERVRAKADAKLAKVEAIPARVRAKAGAKMAKAEARRAEVGRRAEPEETS